MAERKWTEEQCKQQSLSIRQWQPWLHSTRAKTIEGKAASSRNAFTGGLMGNIRSLSKEHHRLFTKQRKQIDDI